MSLSNRNVHCRMVQQLATKEVHGNDRDDYLLGVAGAVGAENEVETEKGKDAAEGENDANIFFSVTSI